ncbi:hypothetical protein V8E36_006448 [Tilletia maclaganii]
MEMNANPSSLIPFGRSRALGVHLVANYGFSSHPLTLLPPTVYRLPVGLINVGDTCYLNALLQYLFSIDVVREEVTQAVVTIRGEGHSWKAEEMQVGEQLISASEVDSLNLSVQQDAGECLQNVILRSEVGRRSVHAEPEMLSKSQKQVLGGSADVAGSRKSGIESLDEYSDDREIQESDLRRTMTLQEAPAILQVQVQRAKYDGRTGKFFKDLRRLVINGDINVGRYVQHVPAAFVVVYGATPL